MADAMVSQGVNYGLKAIDITMNATATTAELLLQAMKMFDGNGSVRAMNKLIKNNETEYVMCDVDEMQTLKSRLEKKGVGVDKDTGKKMEGVLAVMVKDENGKERGMVVYNKKYHDLVVNTIRAFNAERQGGIVDFKSLDTYSDGRMKTINNIDKNELMLFDKQCKAYGVPYAIQGPENGKYEISFADRDRDEMERIRLDTATALTGKSAPIYIKQLEYENQTQLNIRQSVLTGKDKESNENIKVGTVVVDRDGRKIEFTKRGVMCTDEFSQKFYKRDKPDFKKSVDSFFCDMNKPVILEKDEYAKYKLEYNKEYFLIKAEKQQGRPELSQEEMSILANELKQRDIIEKKLMKEHPTDFKERLENYSIEEATFDFDEKEKIQFKDILDKTNPNTLDEELYEVAEDKFLDWDIDDCSTTVEEIELEEEIIEGNVPTNIDIQEDMMLDDISSSHSDMDMDFGTEPPEQDL